MFLTPAMPALLSPLPEQVHFKGFIYAELNQLLLNMVCSADVNATAVRNTTKPARSSLKA